MIRKIRTAAISIALVIAIVLQASFPGRTLSARAGGIANIIQPQAGLPGSPLSALMENVMAEDETPTATNPSSVASPAAWECHQVLLPLVSKTGGSQTSGSQAGSGNSQTALQPAATSTLGPDIAIIQPREGWSVSGMLYFAVQAPGPAKVSSVSFMAGSTHLGTDTTPADGFKVFLDASAFPAGALQLTATATSPCGQTTQSVTVNNVPNPPQSATIGLQGGVLASEIGSNITFQPGAVPDGTGVSVTEKTQEEITAENGFDWDAMGVTFLGAQVISSTAPISLPLVVASAGFGPRVQPGQAVVNYNIFPDADGDGIDELVVVNTASVAPNDDVISDPVPQIQLGSATTSIQAEHLAKRDLSNGISGPPGTVIEFEASGLNPFSSLGNVAIYRSSVDSTEYRIPVAIVPDMDINIKQTVLTIIPPLPPGPSTLVLRNESTGSTVGPFEITVEEPSPLTRPAVEIIDEFLVSASDALNNFSSDLAGEDVFAPSLEAINAAVDKIDESRSLIQQMSNEPELQILLKDIATIIVNSNLSSSLAQAKLGTVNGASSFCDNWPLLALGAGSGLTLGTAFIGFGAYANSAAAAATGAGAIKIALAASALWTGVGAILLVVSLAVIAAIIITCWNYKPEPTQNASSIQSPNGMGSAPPPGGNGAGNAPVPPAPAAVGALSAQGGFLDQQAGRVVVKINSGGSVIPFKGVTDPGGYFFIPFIPEGQPFVATAIDTLTGQTRTFEGVGPPTGESVFMFFDFFSEEPEEPFEPTIRWDGGGDGASWLDPLNWDLDALPGPGDQVLIDVPGTITVTHAGGATPTDIMSLRSEEAIVLSNGTLTISSTAIITTSFTLTDSPLFGGTTLGGSGSLTVEGPFTWDNGTMSGSGITIANGGLTITGDGTKTLSGRILSNGGNATWDGAGSISGGGILNNLLGATFEVKNDATFSNGSGIFGNYGTFIKSAGTGTTLMNGAFNNNGVVDVQSGTLRLYRGGDSSGTFTGGPAGTLNFNAAGSAQTYNLLPGSQVNVFNFYKGPYGTLNVLGDFTVTGLATHAGGTLNLNSGNPVTMTNLTKSGGTMTGASDVIVTGNLTWSGGTISGPAQTIANGTLDIVAGSGSKLLDTRTLVNNGSATWSGTLGISGRNGATIINSAGATFDISASADLYYSSGAPMAFINEGTLTKIGSTTTQSTFAFNNSGTVNVISGTLQLYGGGTSTGSFAVQAGGNLNFSNQTYGANKTDLLAGSSVTGAGTVRMVGGTVNISGTYLLSGATEVTGGTANFAADATTGPLTFSGGTLTGSGTLTANGLFTWIGITMSGPGRTVANGGLIHGGGGTKILSGRTLDNAAISTWASEFSLQLNNGAVFNNLPGATFDVQGDANLTGNGGTFNNQGTFVKSAGTGFTSVQSGVLLINTGTVEVQTGTLNFTSGNSFIQSAGETVLNGGNLRVGVNELTFQGGALSGSGIVTSSVNITGTGQVNPGGIGAAGILAITGNYSQSGTGILNVELGGTGAGTFDRLLVTSLATLDGTLNVSLIGGFVPNIGDMFQVMTYGSRSGVFATINGNGQTYTPNYNPNDLTLVAQ